MGLAVCHPQFDRHQICLRGSDRQLVTVAETVRVEAPEHLMRLGHTVLAKLAISTPHRIFMPFFRSSIKSALIVVGHCGYGTL